MSGLPRYCKKLSAKGPQLCIEADGNTYLIHMLAKQETHMNAKSTVLGLVPAKLSTRVIITLSMFVLLSAEEMVKPPMRSMMVGLNMTENTYLGKMQ